MNKLIVKHILILTLFMGCSKIKLKNNEAYVPKEDLEQVIKAKEETFSLSQEVKPRKFEDAGNSAAINKYCEKTDSKFYQMGWGKSHCKSFKWMHVRNSYLGDPLIWAVFGDEKAHEKEPKNVTMILCGVHGDEITPVKFCYDILHYLHHLEGNPQGHKNFEKNLVVVAPIVTPDSFFKKYPTRTNARGIDVNRNFPTKDWNKLAIKLWKDRYRSDKRRYPGHKANSEQSTIFQVNLIKRYGPNKIISVHAPLTILDYDGPEVAHTHFNPVAHHANHLLVQMSKKAKGYRIKNYPFFPGSLGNYAGNERNIPTYTLELPSSDNRNHKKYWDMFKSSIDYALFYGSMEKGQVVMNEDSGSDDSDVRASNSN